MNRALGFVVVGLGVLLVVGAFLAQGAGTAGLIVVAFTSGAIAERNLGMIRQN